MTRGFSDAAFITCAVTGAGDSTGISPHVPVTPAEIADSAVAAARAGAAIVHIHVRDVVTRQGNRDRAAFREVVERIRSSAVDVIINLTTGMGGTLAIRDVERPLDSLDEHTDMAGASERVAHVIELEPEICTLDIQSLNFSAGGDDIVAVNPPDMVRAMARAVRAAGVRAEVEIFDSGDVTLLKQLVRDGLLDADPLVQLCMGIPYGAPHDMLTLQAMIAQLPADTVFSAFSIGQAQLPYVAMSVLAGGNVRVGLEDNLYLSKGQLATNAQLVERAVSLLGAMNVRVKSAAEVREQLRLGVSPMTSAGVTA